MFMLLYLGIGLLISIISLVVCGGAKDILDEHPIIGALALIISIVWTTALWPFIGLKKVKNKD